MKYRIALVGMALVATTATAQNNAGSNSPYSYYGLGLPNDRTSTLATGTAGTGIALRSNMELNPLNPASYSAMDSLTFHFDIGLSLQNANLSENGRRINARNTSLDHLTAGFRVARNLGVSLGLQPYSTVGYNLTRTTIVETDLGDATETDSHTGEGGLHNAYLGVGWSPVRGLSVGLNAGYLWGDLTHTVSASFSDATASTRNRRYQTEVRSYKLDFGVQYEQRIGEKNIFGLGLTYMLGHKLDGRSTFTDFVGVAGASTGTNADTLSIKDAYDLPHSFGAGLAWTYDGRLRVAVDYTLQKWSDVRVPSVGGTASGTYSYTAATGQFSNRHRVSLGGEYVHHAGSYKWRDNVRYRAGISYASPYLRVNGKEGPRDIIASLGVGLPIRNPMHNSRPITLNLGVQYERVHAKTAGMMTENYLRLCVGLSFSETWFAKWRVR